MEERKYYGFTVSKETAPILRAFFKGAEIYAELSSCGDAVHFEALMTPRQKCRVDNEFGF